MNFTQKIFPELLEIQKEWEIPKKNFLGVQHAGKHLCWICLLNCHIFIVFIKIFLI